MSSYKMPKFRDKQIRNVLKLRSLKRKNALKKIDLEVRIELHSVELNKYQKLAPIKEVDEQSTETQERNNARTKRNNRRETDAFENGSKIKQLSMNNYKPRSPLTEADKSKVKAEFQDHKRYSKVIVDEIMTEVKKSTKKRKAPDPKPEALCFDLKGSTTDHTDVLNEVRKVTNLFRGTSIKFVQFLPREQRWIITMDSIQSRDRLSGSYVTINDTEVQLRRYDDIAKLEYRKYIRANGLIEMVNSIP